jgi:hypothetical protein
MVKSGTSFAHRPTCGLIQCLVKGGCLVMGISKIVKPKGEKIKFHILMRLQFSW